MLSHKSITLGGGIAGSGVCFGCVTTRYGEHFASRIRLPPAPSLLLLLFRRRAGAEFAPGNQKVPARPVQEASGHGLADRADHLTASGSAMIIERDVSSAGTRCARAGDLPSWPIARLLFHAAIRDAAGKLDSKSQVAPQTPPPRPCAAGTQYARPPGRPAVGRAMRVGCLRSVSLGNRNACHSS